MIAPIGLLRWGRFYAHLLFCFKLSSQHRIIQSSDVLAIHIKIISQCSFICKTALFNDPHGRLINRFGAYLNFMQIDPVKAVFNQRFCCLGCIAFALERRADTIFDFGKMIFTVDKEKRDLSYALT